MNLEQITEIIQITEQTNFSRDIQIFWDAATQFQLLVQTKPFARAESKASPNSIGFIHCQMYLQKTVD